MRPVEFTPEQIIEAGERHELEDTVLYRPVRARRRGEVARITLRHAIQDLATWVYAAGQSDEVEAPDAGDTVLRFSVPPGDALGTTNVSPGC